MTRSHRVQSSRAESMVASVLCYCFCNCELSWEMIIMQNILKAFGGLLAWIAFMKLEVIIVTLRLRWSLLLWRSSAVHFISCSPDVLDPLHSPQKYKDTPEQANRSWDSEGRHIAADASSLWSAPRVTAADGGFVNSHLHTLSSFPPTLTPRSEALISSSHKAP